MPRRLVSDVPRRGPDDTGPSHPEPNDGSAAAEFAIVVPVLLLLLFIMVTLSSIFFDQQQLQAAARDSARVGAVRIADACSTAQTALTGNDVGVLTCTTVTTCSTGAVKMSLAATKTYAVPLLGDRTVTLRASSTFVCPQ